MAGAYNRIIRAGVYDRNLVCRACEDRFSPWDYYADKLFNKDWSKFERVTVGECEEARILPSFDYPKLKLFFLSLLWRAAASEDPMFAQVDIGPDMDSLLISVRDSFSGPTDFFGVVLAAFDQDVGMLNPIPTRFSGIKFIQIYFGNFIAYIKVDPRPLPEPFSALAIAADKPLVVVTRSFKESKELRVILPMVLADQQRLQGHGTPQGRA